jgi:hypothetical protein
MIGDVSFMRLRIHDLKGRIRAGGLQSKALNEHGIWIMSRPTRRSYDSSKANCRVRKQPPLAIRARCRRSWRQHDPDSRELGLSWRSGWTLLNSINDYPMPEYPSR